MLNEYVGIGHISHISKINQDENKVKIILNIKRPEKNQEGKYEEDYIPFYLKDDLAKTALEYCKENDLVGIKARIEKKGKSLVLIGKRLSLITSKEEGR